MKLGYENQIVQLLSKLCDLILLQMAFLITSLPIFTVGAGLTALFAVSKKMREDAVTSPLKEYFAQFRANFKVGTLLWLWILLLFGITYTDAWFCAMGASTLAAVGQVISYVLMIGVFLVFVYSFPQAAWFQNSLQRIVKNSLPLALSHPGTTVLAALLYGICFVAAEILRPLFFLLGFSGTVYLASGLFARAFFGNE